MDDSVVAASPGEMEWRCGVCGFQNIDLLSKCDLCDAPAPEDAESAAARPPLAPITNVADARCSPPHKRGGGESHPPARQRSPPEC